MTASTEGATDTAATTDSGPTSLDTGSETGPQTTAGGDTDGSKPDLGAAPDEHCANPGPWPLPEAPLLELPRFVAHSYIDLDQIGWMTKFRSSVGHDYSDAFERCRSMKHYAYPFDEVDWGAVELYAPVAGEVIVVEQERYGSRVQLRSTLHPEIDFVLFHVDLMGPLAPGATIAAGELLGTHYGDQTYSDIAAATTVDGAWRLISWFELMTDDLLAVLQARGGISSPSDIIITQAERDAMALCCTNGQFDDPEELSDWVPLDAGNLAQPTRLGLATLDDDDGRLR